MCPTRATSAIAKRDRCAAPTVTVLTTPKGTNYPVGRMLVASPRTIEAAVRQVPAGAVITLDDLRARLATDAGADYTCPLTTGIFWRIAAEAAEEERALGHPDPMPWWRVVRRDGALLEKSPGGVAAQQARLAAEGVTWQSTRGRIPRVELSAAAPGTVRGRRGTRA